MYYSETIEGKYVDLKCVTVSDAKFTRDIRRDPAFSDCFPKLENTEEEQKEWIKYQQQKEGDYFFVVWDKNGKAIGTIGIYDIHNDVCESGRLAVRGNAFQSIEAQLLAFKFAFEILNLQVVVGYIFAENSRAIRFNKQFGCTLEEPKMYDNNHLMVKAIYTPEKLKIASEKIRSMMYR